MIKNSKTTRPLRINGLRGRMLSVPADTSGIGSNHKEILLLYGQHASLERITSIAEALSPCGNVTVPDLPGFGGMDSFYKIGLKPDLDNFADYLASFIKLQYKRKKVTIVAMSFSFLIVTRMLQKYPELVKKVDILVSFVGFLHKDDFHVKSSIYWLWRSLAFLAGNTLGASVARYGLLRPSFIRFCYRLVAKKHPKLIGANIKEQKKRVDFEINLWQINDVRTRAKTLRIMLTINLCNTQIKLPVHHVSVAGDFYFDNYRVEQHMKIVYSDFENIPVESEAHAPTVIATRDEADAFIPLRLKKLLS